MNPSESNSRLLSPPEIQPLDPQAPVVFLAGPIQGTADWQQQAADFLIQAHPQLLAANPRREYLDGTFDYAAQVDWETAHLRRAGDNGVVFFWLAAETKHHPDRAYAQTTRFELAEWITRHQLRPMLMVIGIEPGFSGARYIRHRVSQDAPDIPILDDLQAGLQVVTELVSASFTPTE